MPRTTVMPVWEAMSPSPHTVGPDATVIEVMREFAERDFNALPVVDHTGVLQGLVTKLDLLRLLRPNARMEVPSLADVGGRPIHEVMRHGVVAVEPDDPMVVAADLMIATGLRSLPVVERGPGPPVLRGMLSRGDLLRALGLEAQGASRAANPAGRRVGLEGS